VTGTQETESYYFEDLQALRERYPSAILSVNTSGFWDYHPHYQALARAFYGNPDYHPRSLPSSYADGDWRQAYLPELTVLSPSQARRGLRRAGLVPVRLGHRLLYRDLNAPPYAFTIDALTLWQLDQPPRRDQVRALPHVHQIDEIAVQVAHPGVVVVQETAYPGWQVRVNGTDAELTPVGGYLGVEIERGDLPAQVVFTYAPRLLYAGALLSGVAGVVFGVYLLRRPTPRAAQTSQTTAPC
jgi:hypothetical protein